ncbi:unnamed protein product, partial [Larinioides sclopetarius]
CICSSIELDTLAQAFVTRRLRSCNVCRGVTYTCCSKYPCRKQSSEARSGRREGHFSKPSHAQFIWFPNSLTSIQLLP